MAEIANKYNVSQQLISRWKAEFTSNMAAVFDKKNHKTEKLIKKHEAEKEALEKKIGQLTMDIVIRGKTNP